MTMWTSISISAPTLDTLPSVNLANDEAEDFLTSVREAAKFGAPTRESIEPLAYEMSASGDSKYEVDGLQEIAALLSLNFPQTTVEVYEEWDGEEPMRRRATYQKGERLPYASYSTQMVRDDIPNLIADAKRAIGALSRAANGDSNDAEIDAGRDVADCLEALIEALS